MNNLISNLQRSAVQVVFKSSFGTGTLLRYKNLNFIVINKHLYSPKAVIQLILCGFNSNTDINLKRNSPNFHYNRVLYSPKDMKWEVSDKYDIVVGLFPSSFDFTVGNCDLFFFPYLSSMSELEFYWSNLYCGDEIFLFGFPRGIFSKFGIPLSLVRKGIVSRLFQSESDLKKYSNTVIIDAMTMQGMSGSPVFKIQSPNSTPKEFEKGVKEGKTKFIGIINQSLYDRKIINQTKIILNDDFSVVQPSFEIGNLMEKLIKKYESGEFGDFKASKGLGFRDENF